jgi:hypothetical protein
MARESDKSRSSPLVLLSLCLSLLALAVAGSALLIVYDKTHPRNVPKEKLGVETVGWNWEQRINQIEASLKEMGERLEGADNATTGPLEEKIDSILTEMRYWVRAAEPRLKDSVTSLTLHARQVKRAIGEQSKDAMEKIDQFYQSLEQFRKRTDAEESEKTAE